MYKNFQNFSNINLEAALNSTVGIIYFQTESHQTYPCMTMKEEVSTVHSTQKRRNIIQVLLIWMQYLKFNWYILTYPVSDHRNIQLRGGWMIFHLSNVQVHFVFY